MMFHIANKRMNAFMIFEERLFSARSILWLIYSFELDILSIQNGPRIHFSLRATAQFLSPIFDMFNIHLEIAAAKAAAVAKRQPSHTSSNGFPVAYKNSDNTRKFTQAFPATDSDNPKRDRLVSSSPSSSAIQIPNFTVAPTIWEKEGEEEAVDKVTNELRGHVMNTINTCLSKQNAPSTINSYESILNKEVGEAQVRLNVRLLPLDNEDKFLTLFGFLRHSSPDLKSSRVQALKSALMKWHARNGEFCIFESWTAVMRALWTGLSRSASHASQGKEPISLDKVIEFLSKSSDDPNPATIRLRAMVVVGFFGVRRCAEILKFAKSDVTISNMGDYHLKVRCQKNDQEGIGMHCVIPSVASLGDSSPTTVLSKWLDCRADFINNDNIDEPLFCTVAGTSSRIGKAVSADSFRKAFGAVCSGNTSTHSLRKGGARFYAAAEAPEQATREQRGWRSSETMKRIYTSLTPDEVKLALHKAANLAGEGHALKELSAAFRSVASASDFPDAAAAIVFVSRVNDLTGKVPWKVLIDCKAGIHFKKLVRHPDKNVREVAVPALGNLRSSWAAHKAQKSSA